MAIGEDKTRTNITFPKELKAKLEELEEQAEMIRQQIKEL